MIFLFLFLFKSQKADFLLHGFANITLQEWLAKSVGKAPPVLPIQLEFINACAKLDKKVKKTRRIVRFAFILVLVLSVIAATVLAVQSEDNYNKSKYQQAVAKQSALFSVYRQSVSLSATFVTEFTEKYNHSYLFCYTANCFVTNFFLFSQQENIYIADPTISAELFRQAMFSSLMISRFTAFQASGRIINGMALVGGFSDICDWGISSQ